MCFFGLFYIINRNGASLLCFHKKMSLAKCDSPKPSNSFCRSRCFSSFSFKKCHIEFTRFSALPIQWNVFHKKKLVSSFFINHFNQIAVQCSRLFSVYHIGSTNEMHTDFIFALVPFSFGRFLYSYIFLFFSSIIHFRHRCVSAAQSTKNSVTENLMSRKNQIHCIIRLMTCYVHLTERSIVPLRFLSDLCNS